MATALRQTLVSLNSAAGAAAVSPISQPEGAVGGSIPFSFHYLAGEVASFFAVVGGLTQSLPSIALLMAIVWYAIVIYESQTFRRLLGLRPAPGCGERKDPPDVIH